MLVLLDPNNQYLKYNIETEVFELVKEKAYSKQIISTTNNRVELLAVIRALQCLNRPCNYVEIISDSTYVVDTINKWIGSFVRDPERSNYDLMLELHAAMVKHKQVKGIWVRGHNGNILNERVNEMAQKAAGTWKQKRSESILQ
jgi:ribonuclease HI